MKRRPGTFWRQTFSSLKVPNYRLYFTGQSISLAGTWMQATAQSWFVLTLTHSSTDLGFTVALQTLPVLLLASYGGAEGSTVSRQLRTLDAHHAVMASASLRRVACTAVSSAPEAADQACSQC